MHVNSHVPPHNTAHEVSIVCLSYCMLNDLHAVLGVQDSPAHTQSHMAKVGVIRNSHPICKQFTVHDVTLSPSSLLGIATK